MEPVGSGHKREPDEASIAAAPQPRASDWLWRPWYAKLWWSAVPVYWIGAAASVKIEWLAAFYGTAFAGYCNMFFFPMTALLVLGVGFARAWIDALPSGEMPLSFESELPWWERESRELGPSVDPRDPASGTLFVGNPLNPLNTVHHQRHN